MIYIIIGAIILIMVLILLCFLLIPFHVSFFLQKQGVDINGYFQLSWMKIRLFQQTIPSPEPKKKKREKEKKEKEKKKFSLSKGLKLFELFYASWEHFFPIIQSIFSSVNLKRLSLIIYFGIDSPVDTALYSGYFWSLAAILNLIPHANFRLYPDFHQERVDGSIDVEIQMRLIKITWEVIKALTKKPVRSFLWEMRSMR